MTNVHMIPFDEALRIVLDKVTRLGSEHIPMMESAGRILAEEVKSDMDMPPFDKSAVDGFACRAEDLLNAESGGITLKIIETIPAGVVPIKTIGPGQCSRIMTGAMVPQGAGRVIMVEDTIPQGEDTIHYSGRKQSANICYKGEDIRSGETVLRKGTVIRPAHIATLAATGNVNPLVSKLPHAGILSTGDELVEPDEKPGLSKIRNSNAFQLLAQVRSVPAIGNYEGIARDHKDELLIKINGGLEKNDILLVTGGVSMGDYDHVPEILEKAGFRIIFKSIAIQPGRPTLFGIKENKFVFGLPGNPVSSFVLFGMLVKPFLLAMMGCTEQPPVILLPMGTAFSRKKSGRQSLIPVRIENGKVFPAEYHGSAHINAYTVAHGIISMEAGASEIKEGTLVHVRSL
ncbi:MAG: gephyrin-like molybdotransferase Glp [bacterium]